MVNKPKTLFLRLFDAGCYCHEGSMIKIVDVQGRRKQVSRGLDEASLHKKRETGREKSRYRNEVFVSVQSYLSFVLYLT